MYLCIIIVFLDLLIPTSSVF